jgi:hypothetical protein
VRGSRPRNETLRRLCAVSSTRGRWTRILHGVTRRVTTSCLRYIFTPNAAFVRLKLKASAVGACCESQRAQGTVEARALAVRHGARTRAALGWHARATAHFECTCKITASRVCMYRAHGLEPSGREERPSGLPQGELDLSCRCTDIFRMYEGCANVASSFWEWTSREGEGTANVNWPSQQGHACVAEQGALATAVCSS